MGFSFNSIFFQFLFLVFGVLFINGIQDHIACVDAMVSDIPIRIFGTPRISFGI